MRSHGILCRRRQVPNVRRRSFGDTSGNSSTSSAQRWQLGGDPMEPGPLAPSGAQTSTSATMGKWSETFCSKRSLGPVTQLFVDARRADVA